MPRIRTELEALTSALEANRLTYRITHRFASSILQTLYTSVETAALRRSMGVSMPDDERGDARHRDRVHPSRGWSGAGAHNEANPMVG